MSDDRRLDVLRAIVEDYVTTNEPVGSRSLVERHGLGVSPATIRNDMAVLEEAGYIAQPHTSAGRVPTDKGYRLFVDRLSAVKPLSAAERRAISAFLTDAVDLDDVVDRSVRLLSQLTHQVAVVQYPSLARSALRHVELVPLDDDRLLVVIITETGRVEQRTVELEHAIAADLVPELRARLNVSAGGRRLSELDGPLTAWSRRSRSPSSPRCAPWWTWSATRSRRRPRSGSSWPGPRTCFGPTGTSPARCAR